MSRGAGVVVEGVCLLVVLIGRLGHHGAGLVGVLNEIPAAVEHEFGPPAVQCKSQAPPDLLEEDGLAHPMADVGPPEAVLVVCSLTRWPVPWPFASLMKWKLRRVMPKPLPEADAPWSGAHEGPEP